MMGGTAVMDTYSILKERKENVPVPYLSTDVSQFMTASDISSNEISERMPSAGLFPLWEFPARPRPLRALKPILTKIYRDEELFIAENETLDVWGSGETQQEAIKDFREQVVHFYKHYKNLSDDKLMGLAIKLKEVYSNLFIEEEHAG